jgi:hypothetical protein
MIKYVWLLFKTFYHHHTSCEALHNFLSSSYAVPTFHTLLYAHVGVQAIMDI